MPNRMRVGQQQMRREVVDCICRLSRFRLPTSASMSSSVGQVQAGWMTKTRAELARKVGVVEKTACSCNVAERLVALQCRPARNQMRGIIEAQRVNEITASHITSREELLKVTHRYAGIGRDTGRRKMRVRESFPDHMTNGREELLRMRGYWELFGR